MIRCVALGLLVALELSSCGSGPPDPDPEDLALAGEWAPVSAELGGWAFPIESFKGANLQLTANTYEFGEDKGGFAVLSTTPPAKMDIGGMEGPNAGRTIRTIYELAGDQLTVCYQLGAGERPTEFKSAVGTQVLLIRYRRVP